MGQLQGGRRKWRMSKVTGISGTILLARGPLVLVGGGSLVHRQWDFLLPILKDHFRVILYDQRGAGLSDRAPIFHACK